MTRFRFAGALAAVLLLAGCAGLQQPMGPARGTPRLAEAQLVSIDGAHLPLRRWQPLATAQRPKAVLVALHGFGDYSHSFEGAASWWAGRGITTYAYDQRGFGDSDNPTIWAGAATMQADADAAVRAVRARHPGVPLYLLGESMGSAVALLTAVEDPALPVDGLILSAPAVWGPETMSFWYRAALATARQVAPGFWLQPPRGLKIRATDNIELLRAMGRDPRMQKGARVDTTAGLVDLMGAALDAAPRIARPTLVMYGRHEQIVPKPATERFLASLPDHVQVAIYPDGWHMLLRDLQAETVWRDVAAWVERPLAPLPSGADGVNKAEIEPTPEY